MEKQFKKKYILKKINPKNKIWKCIPKNIFQIL